MGGWGSAVRTRKKAGGEQGCGRSIAGEKGEQRDAEGGGHGAPETCLLPTEGARLNFLLRGSGEMDSVWDRLENSPGHHLNPWLLWPGSAVGPKAKTSLVQAWGERTRLLHCGKGWSNSSLKNKKEKTARGGRHSGADILSKDG